MWARRYALAEREAHLAASSYTISTAFFTNSGTDPGPYLLPPNYQPPFRTPINPLQIQIPFVAGSTKSGCGIAQGDGTGQNPDFSLSWVAGTGSGTPYAMVAVQPTNLYTPANIATLWQNFIAFKQLVEALPAGCLVPNGLFLLTNRIAIGLPLGFNWILPFIYGFSPDNRYVDLYPGMNLVVDYGSYQYLGAGTSSPGQRNAYAGVGTTRFRLRRRPDGRIGFNAFTDSIGALQVAFDTPNQVAGLWDLEASGASGPHARLIYPATLQNTVTTSPTPTAAQNPVLLFADSLADLETGTSNYVSGGDNQGVGSLVFFSGRAALYPEIVVTVNGVLTPVPFGTTLADVVATQLNLSITEDWGAKKGAVVSMSRWSQNAFVGANPAPYNLTPVLLDIPAGGTISPTTGLSPWDLPLVAGDSVQWIISNS